MSTQDGPPGYLWRALRGRMIKEVYLYRTAFIRGDMRMGYAATRSLFLGIINMAITAIVFVTMRTERN